MTIQEKIKEMGLKQKWVAEQIGVSETLFAHQIAGRRTISKSQIKLLSKILHCNQRDIKNAL